MSQAPKPLTQDEWNYWYGQIFAFFLRRVNSAIEADELTSVTLSDFFLRQRENLEYPQAYLFGIANNKLKMFYRTNKNRKEFLFNDEDLDRIETQALPPTHSYLAKVEVLKTCISKTVNPKDQEFIQLIIEEDFSSLEIAKKLEMQPENVRQRFSRALKKIRQSCKEIWFNS